MSHTCFAYSQGANNFEGFNYALLEVSVCRTDLEQISSGLEAVKRIQNSILLRFYYFIG
jgi:hypothetical protein